MILNLGPHMGCHLLISQALLHKAGSEVEQLVPLWDASILGGCLVCCAIMLACSNFCIRMPASIKLQNIFSLLNFPLVSSFNRRWGLLFRSKLSKCSTFWYCLINYDANTLYVRSRYSIAFP